MGTGGHSKIDVTYQWTIEVARIGFGCTPRVRWELKTERAKQPKPIKTLP
jgi:hypothetical protein